MQRAQLYTSAAGVTVAAIQFHGLNGKDVAAWSCGDFFEPDPSSDDDSYVAVPSFMGMMMNAYPNDYIITVVGLDEWYVLPPDLFLGIYVPMGVWINYEGTE